MTPHNAVTRITLFRAPLKHNMANTHAKPLWEYQPQTTRIFMGVRLFTFMTALIAFALLILSPVARAQIGTNNVPATLVAETTTPAAGSTVTIAIRFKPKSTWHGYWQNPGDAGFGGKFEWTLPKGVSAAAPAYPVPTRLVIAELMNHVFENEHALLVPVTIAPGLTKGTRLALKLRGDWLGCTDEICVPQGGDMVIDLTVGDGSITPESRAQFDGWRAKLPRPLGSEAKFEITGKRARFAIPFPAAATISDPWLFAINENAISYVAPQKISRNGDMLVIETDASGSAFGTFEGVLAIGKDKGLMIKAVPGAVPAAGTPIVAVAETKTSPVGLTTILLALGGALLGGLILNIMPCVFPIISLKALSLAKAGGDEGETRREALAYAAGVILVCVGLGAALLGLRAGGSAVGWAFQLQEPRVILVLLVLVTAIAFNLAGLFELGGLSVSGKLATGSGTSGAFWTGALAAFIATPCTGPFMGAALGAALVLPTAAALAIFAGLGLGLALPFLLLGFVPAFRRMLPKPGAWMETMRHILSVPMFLTALALVWLLGRQAGVNAMVLGLGAAMVATLALWWFGRRQAGGKGGGWIAIAGVTMLMAGGVAALPVDGGQSAVERGESASTNIPFDEVKLTALRAENRPVFLYFTADWCVTCKVNEKAAIERTETVEAFEAKNVAVMVGDWTNADATITRFLNARGVSGVPLYLYYPKGGGEPQILPQVLTVGTLTALTS
jgi:thiol:disulfide interchange protein/DsbC/DsbD-like thiol-disulfide interchange protein